MDKTLGQITYETFNKTLCKEMNYTTPIDWGNVSEGAKKAWEAAGYAAANDLAFFVRTYLAVKKSWDNRLSQLVRLKQYLKEHELD